MNNIQFNPFNPVGVQDAYTVNVMNAKGKVYAELIKRGNTPYKAEGQANLLVDNVIKNIYTYIPNEFSELKKSSCVEFIMTRLDEFALIGVLN